MSASKVEYCAFTPSILSWSWLFLIDRVFSSVTWPLGFVAMSFSVHGSGAVSLVTICCTCVGRDSMCDLRMSVSSGSSGLAGPMPSACRRVCVSSGRVDQLVAKSSVASCCTLDFFSGLTRPSPGGVSGHVDRAFEAGRP